MHVRAGRRSTFALSMYTYLYSSVHPLILVASLECMVPMLKQSINAQRMVLVCLSSLKYKVPDFHRTIMDQQAVRKQHAASNWLKRTSSYLEPPINHVNANVRRIRHVMYESRQRQATKIPKQPIPAKDLWRSKQYDHVQSKVKQRLDEVRRMSSSII